MPTTLSLDLRGTGETDKPEGVYSTELLADDVAAFMQAAGIPRAHVSGLSLGAAAAGIHPAVECGISARRRGAARTNYCTNSDNIWRTDLLTSRFADRLKGNIRDSEVLIFEGCAHAALYEKVEEFNQKTLTFLQRHAGVGIA